MKILNKKKLKKKFMGIGKNAYNLVENELKILMKLVWKSITFIGTSVYTRTS
jgi:hypothetical protein